MAIEVKTGAITQAGLRGLTEFVRRHSDYRPLVLCDRTECAERVLALRRCLGLTIC